MPYAQNLENAMIPTVESIKDAIRKTHNKQLIRKINYVNKIIRREALYLLGAEFSASLIS